VGLPREIIDQDRQLAHRDRPVITGALAFLSVRAIAEHVHVSPTTVQRILREQPGYAPAEDGTIGVRKSFGRDGRRRPNRRFDTVARDAKIIAAHTSCTIFGTTRS
jgi:AraC-like DNA-binding protein